MRLLYINPYRDREIVDPHMLLERYRSMRLWCAALARQGMEVVVWQAFPQDAEQERDGVVYRFRPISRRPDRRWPDEIRAMAPDMVHIDGLIAPLRLFRLLAACRSAGVPAVIQDHGGQTGPGPSWRAAALIPPRPQPAGLLFSATALAAPWLTTGIFPRSTPVLEVMESSTTLTPANRRQARRELGLEGDPLVVSVGRLNRGKDPLTLLEGFAALAANRPGARLALAFQDAPLLPQVKRLISTSPHLGDRVTLLGRLPAEKVRQLLSAADIFTSSSRHEGSGYAALEALACGAVPVLSAIPSFRVMTGKGSIGRHFPVGNAAALGRALEEACTPPDRTGWDRARETILGWFTTELSVDALGRKALSAYVTVAGSEG